MRSTTAPAALSGLLRIDCDISARHRSRAPGSKLAAMRCRYFVSRSPESPPASGIGRTGTPSSKACSTTTSVCCLPEIVITMSTPATMAKRRPRGVLPVITSTAMPSSPTSHSTLTWAGCPNQALDQPHSIFKNIEGARWRSDELPVTRKVWRWRWILFEWRNRR